MWHDVYRWDRNGVPGADTWSRAAPATRALIPSIKSAVSAADPMADVMRTRMMAQMVNEIRASRRRSSPRRARSRSSSRPSASTGLFRTPWRSGPARSGEIGVRIALGAERRDIMRLVLRDGALIATLGSIAGLVIGSSAIRITSSRFLALPSVDLAALILTPLILSAVVLLACYLPARRAGSVDAMDVLRRA